jgi:predicted lipoprotein with Yx(FWY)xxD motif
MRIKAILAVAGLAISITTAACGASAAVNPTTSGPSSASPQAQGASPSPGSVASGATVVATSVGSLGTVLVDAKSGMTVYTFAKDVANSGTSNCTGGCLQTWPALTVAAGSTPTAGDGVTGTLGTITRADDGSLQVTYNGLPLYFFSGDRAPGDGNGVYADWEAVTP